MRILAALTILTMGIAAQSQAQTYGPSSYFPFSYQSVSYSYCLLSLFYLYPFYFLYASYSLFISTSIFTFSYCFFYPHFSFSRQRLFFYLSLYLASSSPPLPLLRISLT